MSNAPVILVTGAGGGVGRELARELADAGRRVALTSRNEERLAATAESIGEAAAIRRPADLTDEGDAAAVVEETISRAGRLDAIAHVAGYASIVGIDAIDADAWRRTIDTNGSALMYLAAAAWPQFRTQGSGRIAAVSSMASLDPFPGFALYAPAKAAENTFVEVAARQGAEIGVDAVSVAPGAIETPMLRALFDEATIPPERTLTPSAVAELIRACLIGERTFRSGETIEMPSP